MPVIPPERREELGSLKSVNIRGLHTFELDQLLHAIGNVKHSTVKDAG